MQEAVVMDGERAVSSSREKPIPGREQALSDIRLQIPERQN